MVTVPYFTLLCSVADLAGLDRDNIPSDEEQIIRSHLSRRLGMAWDAYYWPDIMNLEKRTYRADYSASETLTGATTTTVSERFFPQTGKCYQALRAMPLAVAALVRTGTTATAAFASNHLLSTGDQVTISGASPAGFNITATITVTASDQFEYTLESDPGADATGTIKCGVNPANTEDETQERYWAVCSEDYGAADYSRSSAYVVGDQVYYPPTDRSYQCITDSPAGFLPTTTAVFAPLTDFDRYVAYEQSGETKIGDVVGVYDKSPRAWRDAVSVDYQLSPNGIQVLEDNRDTVWIEFKTKTPVLVGDTFSTSATYTANVDQVYFRGSTSSYPGNMYDCIVTTTAGQSPQTTAASWSVVNIPRIFQRYLERGAFADYLISTGQSEKAMAEDAKAEQLMTELRYKVGATQNQVRRNIVLTR